jgi:CubicO group peptidase (beta-lactamase class C family)
MYVGAPPEALPRAAQLIWPQRSFMHLTAPLEGESRLVPLLMRGGATALEWLLRIPGLQVDFESILDSLAPRGISSFDFGAAATLQASIPAANGLFTARSLARMYAALAGGGEIDGVRLLSERTLQRATRVQPRAAGLKVMPYDMRWRLGYHGVLTSRGVPRHAFGHFGFGGSGAWADPSRNLAVGMIVNSGMGTPFGDLRIVRIGGAVLQCAQAWPRAVSLRRRQRLMHAPAKNAELRRVKVVGLRSRA